MQVHSIEINSCDIFIYIIKIRYHFNCYKKYCIYMFEYVLFKKNKIIKNILLFG
jgi:hypothetical protein